MRIFKILSESRPAAIHLFLVSSQKSVVTGIVAWMTFDHLVPVKGFLVFHSFTRMHPAVDLYLFCSGFALCF